MKLHKNKKYILYSVALIVLIFQQVLFPAENTGIEYSRSEYPLIVKYLDVGQGDSELILLPDNKTILIDAGEREYSDNIIDELNACDIEKIDYLIATHPHSDHIGGMKRIIEDYEIGNIYMPRTEHNSATYFNLLETIADKGLKINIAKAGISIIDEDDLKAQFVAPSNDFYEEMNDHSAVLKITYKKTSFLFTGDAETLSENEIIKNGYDISADVLKVGHHGSSTSTSDEFLDAVNPKYAVISCSLDNDYGHPHRETLEKLKSIPVFRTDKMGTITMYSNGEEIKIDIAKGKMP